MVFPGLAGKNTPQCPQSGGKSRWKGVDPSYRGRGWIVVQNEKRAQGELGL